MGDDSNVTINPVSILDQGTVNTAEAVAGVIVLGLVGWGIYAATRKKSKKGRK